MADKPKKKKKKKVPPSFTSKRCEAGASHRDLPSPSEEGSYLRLIDFRITQL